MLHDDDVKRPIAQLLLLSLQLIVLNACSDSSRPYDSFNGNDGTAAALLLLGAAEAWHSPSGVVVVDDEEAE